MTMPQPAEKAQQGGLAGKPAAFGGKPPAPAGKRPSGEPWSDDHPVDIRLSIPLPFARYYVTIVAGKERRGRERLASERRKHPVLKRGNLVVAAGCGLVCGLAMLSIFQLATAQLLQRLGVMVLP